MNPKTEEKTFTQTLGHYYRSKSVRLWVIGILILIVIWLLYSVW